MIEKRIIAAMVAVFLLIMPVSVTADGGEDVFAGFYIKNVSITDETLVFDLYYSDTEGLGLASVGIYMEYSDGVSLTDFERYVSQGMLVSSQTVEVKPYFLAWIGGTVALGTGEVPIAGFEFAVTDMSDVSVSMYFDERNMPADIDGNYIAEDRFYLDSLNAPTANDFAYTVTEGYATVVGYTGSAAELTVPDTLDSYPVRAVGDGAFAGAQSIRCVTLPEGITHIGVSAFEGCDSLETVVLPESLLYVGERAFGGCTSLEDLFYVGSAESLEAVFFEEELSQMTVAYLHTDVTDTDDHYVLQSTDATCSEAGVAVYVCSCGYERAVSAAAGSEGAGHIDTVTVGYTAATCVADGYTGNVFCNDCRSVVKNGELIPAGSPDSVHGNTALVGVIAATCTEDGYTGDFYCYDCETVLEFGQVIYGAHGEPVCFGRTEPTCTEEGFSGMICCSVCRQILSQGEVLPATAHKNSVTESKAPTCTEDGYEGRITCADCGAVLEEGQTVPASGHLNCQVYGEVAAGCTEDGFTGVYCCLDCMTVLEEGQTVPATGHTLGEWVTVTEPTYTTEGLRTRSCALCGLVLESEVLEVLTFVPGDATGDGVVNSTDITTVLRYIARMATEIDLTAADVNGDGMINSADVTVLRRMVAGLSAG